MNSSKLIADSAEEETNNRSENGITLNWYEVRSFTAQNKLFLRTFPLVSLDSGFSEATS